MYCTSITFVPWIAYRVRRTAKVKKVQTSICVIPTPARKKCVLWRPWDDGAISCSYKTITSLLLYTCVLYEPKNSAGKFTHRLRVVNTYVLIIYKINLADLYSFCPFWVKLYCIWSEITCKETDQMIRETTTKHNFLTKHYCITKPNVITVSLYLFLLLFKFSVFVAFNDN